MLKKLIDRKIITQGVLIGFLVFNILLKLIGDVLFYFVVSLESSYFLIWKVFITFTLFAISAVYIQLKFIKYDETEKETVDNDYFGDLKILTILFLILLISILLLPSSLADGFIINNVVALLFADIISLLAIGIVLFSLNFLFQWLWFRRHKKSKTYLKTLSVLIFISIVLQFINQITGSNGDVPELFKVNFALLLSVAFIFSFISAKKNSWIAYLPKNRKWKLIFISIFLIHIFILVTVFALNSETGKLHNALSLFFGAPQIIAVVMLIGIAYFIRIMFAAILALPTTRIVEQRTYEVSSLTYLNSVVARTSDSESLLKTVTKLAMTTSGAISAWTEVYNNENKVSIVCTENIPVEVIDNFHFSNDIKNYFISLQEPLFIETVKDCKEKMLGDICKILNSKSLIAMPLFAGEDRIGTLVVLHPEEFNFEREYIHVLKAFSDNVNIALENNRLWEESLSKERYKREMMLAKEIEERLLPQNLPVLPDFSISAFAMPAEEVGGDYYDIVTLKNGLPCLLIGDVSGKGMSAAFYMVLLKGVVLAVSGEATGPADLISRINKTLVHSMEKQMFITLSALLPLGNGNFRFARAGHTSMIVKKTNEVFSLIPKGIGIGLAKSKLFDSVIEEIDLKLEKDDAILLYTDGIVEQKNTDGSEFDENSLKQILENSVYNNAGELIEIIKSNLVTENIQESQRDDMTLIALHHN